MTVHAADKLIESFPYPSIPKIEGTPCYETIAEVIMMLSANAASVQTNLGCGTLGFLWLVVTPNVYNTLSNTPVDPPPNPGAAPIYREANGIGQVTIRHEFASATNLYNLYINMEKALRQQLLGTVDEIYTRSLRNRYTGYGTSTTR